MSVRDNDEVTRNAPLENLTEGTLAWFRSVHASVLKSKVKKTHQSCPALRRILRDPSGESPSLYEKANGVDRACGILSSESYHWSTQLTVGWVCDGYMR